MEELKADKTYHLVQNIRDNATNHYDFKSAKKNLKHIGENANCNFYLHKMDGNSYYPLGEEMMFVGRVNRFGSSLGTKEERAKLLSDWMEWNLRANRWARGVHVSAFVKIVDAKFPKRSAWSKKHYVPTRLVSEVDEPSVPIFFRWSNL